MNNSGNYRKLFEIASQQGGYFTAKQAVEAGYSYRLHYYHSHRGNWRNVDRGVFRLVDFPNSPHEDLVRWSLWSRSRQDIPQAVFSHETALSLHEISEVMPGRIHATVSPGFRKRTAGCVIHKAILKPEEIEKREGFFVTTPIRTIIDVAEGNISPEQVEKAVRDAFNKGLIRMEDLSKINVSQEARQKIRAALENIKKNPFF
ncbi:MAG: hypothetical protein HZA28_08375 [Candidatus Omnitrophica bacterium]|nr:hypothetical protein [Candidatus Omnitrophota bacterium]